ncbi:Glucosamine-6-phosphate isomerase (Glucosamine-6-phosphate deaminase) (GNPDA) (GlcN6P deaminase) [Vanrija albida]|uniref:Beta-hexosaminidase n=1 Tax=Vanrija albida TaxID=181172 RepID=A0ABR3PT23_9TREE
MHPQTLLALAALLAPPAAALNLWPAPASHTRGNATVCLGARFRIAVPRDAPADLRAAAARTQEGIRASRHTFLSPARGAEFLAGGCAAYLDELVLAYSGGRADTIAAAATLPVEKRAEAEAYTLDVGVGGRATATAASSLGLLRALTTFENLWFKFHPKAHGDATTYAPYAPYHIDDRPAFPWRAVLLDTSRHFFSVATIKRQLDIMSLVKLNVLHWHIVDSQSWPLALKAFPRLAATGAYSPAEVYSEAQVKSIVQYAAERGIYVVVETDTPGHTSIIYDAYPDYIACFEKRPWTAYANEPPAGQLRFADQKVTAFVSSLFRSIASLTRSAYFGTGGDELNVKCYDEDAPTQAVLKANNWTLEDALKNFTVQTHDTLRGAGKTPVVWEEMAIAHGDTGLDPATVVQVWISSDSVKQVADRGLRIVHASREYLYLDCGQGGWVTADGGLNSWCDPYKTWARIYSFDPYNGTTPAQRAQVLGGQASLWAEQTDEANIDGQLWPRAAALAEVLWTGGGDGGFPLSAVAVTARLQDIRYRIVDRGVRAVPIQPEWCALRPGQCNLAG